jgi:hypothetical protein
MSTKDLISYPIVEKMLYKYVASLPEESKFNFFERYRNSGSNSFYSMLDNYFFTLGMISSNIDFVNETQCHPYLKFQVENAWLIEPGLLSLSDHKVTYSVAQELLGNKLVELLNQTPII